MSELPTPRYGHDPIKMERAEQPFTKAGQFCWRMDKQRRRSIIIAIPRSKDLKSFTACEWTIDYKNHCDAQWSWNKDKVNPTLNPSLWWKGAWHGWVKNGIMVEA